MRRSVGVPLGRPGPPWTGRGLIADKFAARPDANSPTRSAINDSYVGAIYNNGSRPRLCKNVSSLSDMGNGVRSEVADL